VEVLEDDENWAILGDGMEELQDGAKEPCLTLIRPHRGWATGTAPAPSSALLVSQRGPRAREPRWQEPPDPCHPFPRRLPVAPNLVRWLCGKEAAKGGGEGAIRVAAPSRVGGGMKNGKGSRQLPHSANGLADEPARSHPAVARNEEGRGLAVEGSLQDAGNLGQLPLPSHEPGANHRVGHEGIVWVDNGIVASETSEGQPQVHPENRLNELSGEAWLYFTKSVWTTAYPSELGHQLRRRHGANKPPRLMARLIEFFTRTGELVLDPFAGVGGTLLGAAIARGPRRALGIELDPRWIEVFRQVVASAGSLDAPLQLPDLGPVDPGGPRTFDPSGIEMRQGDALEILPALPSASVDFVATDPPYNVQLPMTMAGGRLAARFANRRTDYNMRSEHPGDLANSPSYAAYLDRMETVFGELRRLLRPGRYAAVIVRDAYQKGRYLFTAADLATRAERAGLTPKGDVIWYQAGTRLRPYGYPHAFVPNITHQHILVFRREP
jgi:DNA modification methylase